MVSTAVGPGLPFSLMAFVIESQPLLETYYAMHVQSPMGWTNEIDLRPFQEDWTY